LRKQNLEVHVLILAAFPKRLVGELPIFLMIKSSCLMVTDFSRDQSQISIMNSLRRIEIVRFND